MARNVREAVETVPRAHTERAQSAASYSPFILADASADASELRARMDAHGHLFFPGLLPVASVLEARAEALELCREVGWIDPAAAPQEARWSANAPPPLDGSPEWLAFYRRWLQAPAFNALPERSAVVAVAEKLLGDAVLVHPRKIGRIGFPQNEGHQTPVHQDFFHVRGTTDTYTAWVPLGACARRLGCLAVADGSHKLGFREHEPSAGPGGFAVEPGDGAGVVLPGLRSWRYGDLSFADNAQGTS